MLKKPNLNVSNILNPNDGFGHRLSPKGPGEVTNSKQCVLSSGVLIVCGVEVDSPFLFVVALVTGDFFSKSDTCASFSGSLSDDDISGVAVPIFASSVFDSLLEVSIAFAETLLSTCSSDSVILNFFELTRLIMRDRSTSMD